LGRETKAFRGIVSFQQLNLLFASRRPKAQSRGADEAREPGFIAKF
jgi:hypothetical protein